MAKSKKGAPKSDSDDDTTPPPPVDEADVKQEEEQLEGEDDVVEEEEEEQEVVEEDTEDVEAEEDDAAEQFDDAQEHEEVSVSPIKGFPSPLKRPPAASIASPPPYAIPTAGSPPPGYSPHPGGSPPPQMPPYYPGYGAPPGYHYPYHHHYSYPYPPNSASSRPTTSKRKSPPASTARTASAVYPATPASNSAVNMEAGRPNSAKKVSPKATPTPNTVASSLTTSGTPAATPSGKPQRGLRHFSVMVCKHVEERGVTTYNQVADELVSQVVTERTQQGQIKKGKFDEKNIRRRVYDALNVLLAMGIISKNKKDIIWNGLPKSLADTNLEDDNTGDDDDAAPAAPPVAAPPVAVPPVAAAPKPAYTDEPEYNEEEFAAMEREREYLEAEIARKQESLREVLVQQVCFRNLVVRNQLREYPTPEGPHVPPPEGEKIPLPFIICNTKPSAVVQCDMNREKSDVMFEFDSPFEINDDNTILKRMKMDKTSVPALHDMLPEDMFEYCHGAGLLESVLLPGEDPLAPRRNPYYQYDRAYRY